MIIKHYYINIRHKIWNYFSMGNLSFWNFLYLTKPGLLYMLSNKYQSIRNKCFVYVKSMCILIKNNHFKKNYNIIEQFTPLIGGGEFRWHCKHLSDSI